MADGVAITAGAGTTVATDDMGADGHAQYVKLLANTDGTKVNLSVAEDQASAGGDYGIVAMAVRKDTPAALSGTDGDYEPMQVKGGALWTRPLHSIVTVTTSLTRPADVTAYVAGDAITDSTSAPADMTFSNCARVSGGSGTIIGAVFITDNDPATRLSGELWLYDTTITMTNDNSAFSVTDTDQLKLVDIIGFSMFDAGSNGVASVGNLNIGFTCSGSANLYGELRTRAAYTPASGEVITVRLKILQAD